MPDNLQWQRDGARLVLQGELDQETVGTLWERRETVMAGIQVIDFSAIDRVDTSGLALIIHLVNEGQRKGKRMALEGVSDKLMTLAQLYNLPASLMPVAAN